MVALSLSLCLSHTRSRPRLWQLGAGSCTVICDCVTVCPLCLSRSLPKTAGWPPLAVCTQLFCTTPVHAGPRARLATHQRLHTQQDSTAHRRANRQQRTVSLCSGFARAAHGATASALLGALLCGVAVGLAGSERHRNTLIPAAELSVQRGDALHDGGDVVGGGVGGLRRALRGAVRQPAGERQRDRRRTHEWMRW